MQAVRVDRRGAVRSTGASLRNSAFLALSLLLIGGVCVRAPASPGAAKKQNADREQATVAVDADSARALAWVERAVAFWGGATLLDSTRSFEVAGAMALRDGKDAQVAEARNLIVFPHCLRQEHTYTDGRHFLKVLDGDHAFMSAGGKIMPLPEALRREMQEDFFHNRLVLLRLRSEASFTWVGEEMLGNMRVALLDARLHGVATRLGIDQETGKLVLTSYRAINDEGEPGTLERIYRDFSMVDGRRIATRVDATFDGHPYFTGGEQDVRFAFDRHSLEDCKRRPDTPPA